MPPPRPVPDPDTAAFWAATARHELALPYCADCDRLLYPPPPRCPGCLRPVMRWRQMSGRGSLAGWTVVHTALVPGIDAPYVVAEVELAEQRGLVLTTTLVEVVPRALRLGIDVEVVWSNRDDGFDDGTVSLPRFRPVGVSA